MTRTLTNYMMILEGGEFLSFLLLLTLCSMHSPGLTKKNPHHSSLLVTMKLLSCLQSLLNLGMDQGPQGPSGRKGAIGSVSSRAKFQELRHWCIASKLFTTGAFVWEKRSNFHMFQSESLTTAILETLVTQSGVRVRRFLSFSNTLPFLLFRLV